MNIIAGSVAVGRHGTGAVAESLYLDPRQKTERRGLLWTFETSKPETLVTYLL